MPVILSGAKTLKPPYPVSHRMLRSALDDSKKSVKLDTIVFQRQAFKQIPDCPRPANRDDGSMSLKADADRRQRQMTNSDKKGQTQ